MLTVLSSVFALGVLGACGDVEEPVNEDPAIENNAVINDEGNM